MLWTKKYCKAVKRPPPKYREVSLDHEPSYNMQEPGFLTLQLYFTSAYGYCLSATLRKAKLQVQLPTGRLGVNIPGVINREYGGNLSLPLVDVHIITHNFPLPIECHVHHNETQSNIVTCAEMVRNVCGICHSIGSGKFIVYYMYIHEQ